MYATKTDARMLRENLCVLVKCCRKNVPLHQKFEFLLSAQSPELRGMNTEH